MTIAARPTTYAGIPMRSRLEATVAAMLDRIGCQWEYEPRAYAGRSGQYLPDFQVIGVEGRHVQRPLFIEVRPTIDGAYRAMTQMPVIWESEPAACLYVMVYPLRLMWDSMPERRVWKLVEFSDTVDGGGGRAP